MSTVPRQHLPLPLPLVGLVRDTLVPLVDSFRRAQAGDGSVPRPAAGAERLLERILTTVEPILADLGEEVLIEALRADVSDWRAAGLHRPPHFDRTRDAFTPAADGGVNLFLGPVVTTNGPDHGGHRLECFVARRDEPSECGDLAMAYPHPHNTCQSMRLLTASAGFRTGNCIVFFPENIAAVSRPEAQRFAMFFFNKFQPIYQQETLVLARAVLDGPGTGRPRGWLSEWMSPADCYRARCAWGYLHDYYHHHGPRPLHLHLKLKLNWYVGLLEEVKVDAQAALAAQGAAVPFGAEQVELIVLERLFRYPAHPDATRNFDAGTGVLLFSWLRQHGVLRPSSGGRFHLDWTTLPAALDGLVTRIETMEAEPLDDPTYTQRARELVLDLLNEGRPGQRFAFSAEQRVLSATWHDRTPLDFASLLG